VGGVRAGPLVGGSGRAGGRVRDRSLRGASGGGEPLTSNLPPDDGERSELDEALFSGTEPEDAPAPRPPDPDEDLTHLDAELFGEDAVERDATTEHVVDKPANGRGKRFGLGALIMLVVLGLGGLAYAAFGRADDDSAPKKAKIEVRGTEVTRTTLRSTTTSSTSTSSTTTSTTTTSSTTSTTRPRTVVPETEAPVVEPPATEPPPPPVTEPPPTTPTLPPTTQPPPTTTTLEPPPVTAFAAPNAR
jgi:cytoskeletal protein RodZ